ncbi:MAG: AAA family ATPase [Clostridiales bacterium]|nr:AAA family ATPase [Clostridiales bacterium]
MKKPIKISITGDLGSGKSTVCKLIRDAFGLRIYSTGAALRSLAEKYNMDVLEFNKYVETHPEIDVEIDTALTEAGKGAEDLILDSRMAWHFVPDSYKVYLSVAPEIAAKRIFEAERGSIETYSGIDDAREKILQRKASENLRYLAKYGVDCSDMNNFDLVVDTSCITPEEVASKIMDSFNSHR